MQRQSNVYARGYHQLTIDLSPGKERGFTWKVPNPFKEGQKKTLDKFEIIRKLETIRTQLTNIKNSFKLFNTTQNK
jgi:hypothetical protein